MRKTHIHLGYAILASLLSGALRAQSAIQVWQPPYNITGNDPTHDDTAGLQNAINDAIIQGISAVQLKAGTQYYLQASSSPNSLVIWSTLTLEGNGATLVDKRSSGGFYGDTLHISGLDAGMPIFGALDGTYNIHGHAMVFSKSGSTTVYGGASVPASGVKVKDLTIFHQTATAFVNSVGLTFASGAALTRVFSIGAPQTAFAIVCGDSSHPVSGFMLNGCAAKDAGHESYRVSLQSNGSVLNGTLNACTSTQPGTISSADTSCSSPTDSLQSQRHLHLWYRAGISASRASNVGLLIQDCLFDDTGELYATQGAANLTIQNSAFAGGTAFFTWASLGSQVLLSGNYINCANAKSELNTSEACVYMRGIPAPALNSNHIAGDSSSWYVTDGTVSTQTNFWLNGTGIMTF